MLVVPLSNCPHLNFQRPIPILPRRTFHNPNILTQPEKETPSHFAKNLVPLASHPNCTTSHLATSPRGQGAQLAHNPHVPLP